ncbi:MAG: hypothetical protein E4H03_02035 [Myxococcales bacterium]|nr:MAG: hypothetical protein E4H03_02035 [Myxococcales bacterium]
MRISGTSPSMRVSLVLTMTLDPDVAAVGEVVDGTLVVANQGLVALTGVEVEVLLPPEMANFALASATGAPAACAGAAFPTVCSAGERLVFTVGTLGVGADATLRFPPAAIVGTPAGTQLVFEARARGAGGVNTALRDGVRVVSP